MNVSSIVIKAKPEHTDEVMKTLAESGLCEVHFNDGQGRIVVTIEGRSIEEEMDKMKRISALPNVLSAELSYAYSEDELAEAKAKLDTVTDTVPDMLKEQA